MMISYQIVRVVPSLVASLEPSVHHRNVASLSFFVNVNLNWLNLFHFLILLAGPLVILIGCMIFMSPFLVVIMISMSTVPFLTQLDSGILYPQYSFL